MPMRETNLAYAIQMQPSLRYRIEAIAKDRLWDTVEADPAQHVPLDHLAWAVASNDEIRKTVRAAFSAPEDPDVGRGVEAIGDAALAPIVYAAMQRLRMLPTA